MTTLIITVIVIVAIVALLIWLFPALKYRAKDAQKAINEKLSDPVSDHGHRIDEAKDKVKATQQEVVEAITANKGLRQKVEAAQREAEKYSRLSENAAKAGDVEAVQKFVKDKQRAEARVKAFLTQIDANDHIIASVREQVEQRKDQIENAEANKEILEAQLSGTKLRQDMAKTGSGLADDDLGDLGTLQSHVDEETARAEAYEEVYGKKDVDLEEKYANEGTTVDDEAAALLAKYRD